MAVVADVVSDMRSDPPVHHWIVQREGSPAVIQWGQESTFEDAEREANLYLNRIVEREAKSG